MIQLGSRNYVTVIKYDFSMLKRTREFRTFRSLFLRPVTRGPLRRLEFVPVRCLSVSAQCANFDGSGGNGTNKCPECGAPMVAVSKVQIGARFFECKGNG